MLAFMTPGLIVLAILAVVVIVLIRVLNRNKRTS